MTENKETTPKWFPADEYHKPLNPKKSEAALAQQGARITKKVDGKIIYELPIPTNIDELVKKKTEEDFQDAKKMREDIGDNKI